MNRFKDYSFENDDIFNRRDLARNLSKVVEESNNSVVLALNSYWGSGKTIFIKKWKNSLENE